MLSFVQLRSGCWVRPRPQEFVPRHGKVPGSFGGTSWSREQICLASSVLNSINRAPIFWGGHGDRTKTGPHLGGDGQDGCWWLLAPINPCITISEMVLEIPPPPPQCPDPLQLAPFPAGPNMGCNGLWLGGQPVGASQGDPRAPRARAGLLLLSASNLRLELVPLSSKRRRRKQGKVYI